MRRLAGIIGGLSLKARRLTGYSERVATASLAMMLEPGHAQTIAETWLHEAWAARRRAAFTLPPSMLSVEPGDLIETDEAGLRLLHRVTSVADHGAREVETLSVEPAIYEPHETPQRSQPVLPPPVTGQADALFLDLPLVEDGGAETDGYVALHQAPWPGPMVVYQSPGEDGYVLAATTDATATIGTLLDAMPSGPPGRLDYATRVQVQLASGSLRSESRLALLDGANAIGVLRDDGSWEICQFESATLVEELTYELSGFLRGQQGTEDGQASSAIVAAAGQPIVVLDGTLARVALSEGGVGRPLNWRYGPAGRDIGHASYSQDNHAFAGIARRPFAPVHVRGRRTAGDIEMSWVRRTRSGGDNWEQPEVALGEQIENYEIDILNGGEVVRTLASASPNVVYGVADQVADFGAAQGSVACRVVQMSATWGRGRARDATV